MIDVRGLTFSYPQSARPALREVNWHVGDGEFVLVAGPSGSGKSTLLRCLNGLVPHFSGGTIAGEVTVDGLDVVTAGPRRLSRMVGFVAQDPEAQAVLDQVEGEIAFALENAAIPPAEMRVRVEETLDLLDLAPLRDRSLSTLSGGERQRLAIAAALALRPHILVLDEPTSQLDPQSAEDVLRALVRLNEDLGLTIILAEHRLERIIRHADRLTWLDDGRIAADGPARDVLTRTHVARLRQAIRPSPRGDPQCTRIIAVDCLDDASRSLAVPRFSHGSHAVCRLAGTYALFQQLRLGKRRVVRPEVLVDLPVRVDTFADLLQLDLVGQMARCRGKDTLHLVVAAVEQEADHRLRIVRLIANIGHSNDTRAGIEFTRAIILCAGIGNTCRCKKRNE